MFQSPQWGSNSKGNPQDTSSSISITGFSPRNGEVILKCAEARPTKKDLGFSPRNGEVILKSNSTVAVSLSNCFSPRNGEVILKWRYELLEGYSKSFSPRNGEVILKELLISSARSILVSVPAMGK